MPDYNELVDNIEKKLKGQSALEFSKLEPEKTIVLVIDMTKGFARKGLLSSPRVEKIIPEIKQIVNKAKDKEIKIIYFADAHSEDSPEVNRMGEHCIENTAESEIVDELKGKEDKLILKNSTNGFLSDKFMAWLKENEQNIENYIVTGCVTDICIYNFATTLRAYLDKEKLETDIYVPYNAVQTYDLELHDGDLMHNVYLYGMLNYGIKVVSSVK